MIAFRRTLGIVAKTVPFRLFTPVVFGLLSQPETSVRDCDSELYLMLNADPPLTLRAVIFRPPDQACL